MELPAELDLATDRINRMEDRRIRDAGFGDSIRGIAITERWLEPLLATLKAKLAETSPITLFLKDLDLEVIGVCLLGTCLHAISIQEGRSLRDVALLIGIELQGECWAAGLLKRDSRLAGRIARAAKLKHGSVAYRKQAARSMAAREGYRQKNWGPKQQLQAGSWGLDVLLEALPDCIVTIPADAWGERHVTLTEGALGVAEDAIADAVLRRPTWLPLTEPPAPWTELDRGGSTDPRMARFAKAVRSVDKVRQKAVHHAIKTGQMQPALDALNTLQAVPWTINRPVLAFQQWAWRAGIKLPGLPPRDEIEKPEHPGDAAADEAKKAWRTRAAAIEQDNRTYRAQRLLMLEDLHTALDMKRAERFWCPMNLDWRGRVYPMCHFNYQREDRVRSLFLFAEGKPIGERGLYWLKVHLANLSDGLGWDDVAKPSKLNFDERVAWIERHETMFQAVAQQVLQSRTLEQVAKHMSPLGEPFLWLAAAIELSLALATGSTFITRLPVAFDGSCSGLQHLCAMTRAPEGSLVNLTPSPRPQDVYQTVADRVAATVTADAASTDATNRDVAQAALAYGINRSLVKRNVMTYSYSSKPYGMAQQHQEDLMEPLRRKVTLGELDKHPYGEQTSKAATYLARTTYAAIEEVVHLPAQAMAFLQKLAKALAHEGKPLRWTTPVGLPWINRYTDPTTERVSLWLHDHGVRIRYQVKLATGEGRGINKESAANGVAPNFVHALDAAHLLLTTLAARAVGVTAVATVHDSFGCLAPDSDEYRDVIRRQFVSLYTEHDPLREVLEQARADLTEANHDKLPSLPTYGPLDINEVTNAPYCFA